jgi:predicted alpha/beta hydrolase family esterase
LSAFNGIPFDLVASFTERSEHLFILRLLERTVEPIVGAFLVAGFLGPLDLPDFDRINAEFVLPPVDWPRVKRGAKSFFVYGSDDDPYVPLNGVEDIANALGVQLVLMEQAGHLNADSGFSSFPALLIDLAALLQN